jgi:hypothetical protein
MTILKQNHFFGREKELAFLDLVRLQDGPDIIGIYGLAGIGKSRLLEQFLKQRVKNNQQSVFFDCQLIEPTPCAFLFALSGQLAIEATSLEQLKVALEEVTIPILLILDQFESFRLLDSWLCCNFMPTMQSKIRMIFAGRIKPDNQWLIHSPRNCIFHSLRLETLSTYEAKAYLSAVGLDDDSASIINQFAEGHPLALRLASLAILEQPARQINAASLENAIQTLANYFVDDIKDAKLRQAIEATATVRRVSETVLAGMLDIADGSEIYHQLTEIEFIECRCDGLSLHEVLKNAIVFSLKAKSPRRQSEYRNRAWRILKIEMQTASSSTYWRYIADIIYLIDNPVIRDAFFPANDNNEYTVQPAEIADFDFIMAIVKRHEPQSVHASYIHWWHLLPETFHVIKNSEDKIVGFYCLINPEQLDVNALGMDPIIDNWWQDLQKRTVNDKRPHTLFVRRWLSFEDGEALSGVQAACWLDIKRIYMAMRPNLHHVYMTVENEMPFASVAKDLGFVLLPSRITFNERSYTTAFLDFGEGSIDEWMSRTLMREIEMVGGTSFPSWFDKNAHQVVFNQNRTDLTRLEYGVLSTLIANEGIAISRTELLENVWDIHYDGASNVVDTVVVSLRKKLLDKASLVQAVRGVGYRYLTQS